MFSPGNSPLKKLSVKTGMFFSPMRVEHDDIELMELEGEFPQLIKEISGGVA
jgi:hypothetical protein